MVATMREKALLKENLRLKKLFKMWWVEIARMEKTLGKTVKLLREIREYLLKLPSS